MKQVIVGMVGHPGAGKSTFAKELVKKFGFSHINKDDFRDFLEQNIKEYAGADKSHENEKIASVNRVVNVAFEKLVEELVSRGVSIIIDGYGKFQKHRNDIKELLLKKEIHIPIIIIYVVEDRKVILERLKKRDLIRKEKWIKNFIDFWEPNFSEPKKEECDLLVKVDKNNYSEAIKKIRKFIA